MNAAKNSLNNYCNKLNNHRSALEFISLIKFVL